MSIGVLHNLQSLWIKSDFFSEAGVFLPDSFTLMLNFLSDLLSDVLMLEVFLVFFLLLELVSIILFDFLMLFTGVVGCLVSLVIFLDFPIEFSLVLLLPLLRLILLLLLKLFLIFCCCCCFYLLLFLSFISLYNNPLILYNNYYKQNRP